MGGAVCCDDNYSGPPDLRLAERPVKNGSNFRIEGHIDIDIDVHDDSGVNKNHDNRGNNNRIIAVKAPTPKARKPSPEPVKKAEAAVEGRKINE